MTDHRAAAAGVRRAWAVYIVAGSLATAVFFTVEMPALAREAIEVFLPLACVIAIVAGIRINRPSRSRPWSLFAVGMSFFLSNNVAHFAYRVATSEHLPDDYPDELVEVAGYTLVIAALISLIYSRKGGDRDKSSLIDATIIVVGAGMLLWIFVVAPFARIDVLPVAERVFRLGYAFADLLLLAVSVRLAMSKGARTTPFFLLLAAMLASLFSNTAVLVVSSREGMVGPVDPIGIGFKLAYVFAGAAPLHPAMKRLTDVGYDEVRLTKARLALFGAVSVAGPLGYVLEDLTGRVVDVPVLLFGSLTIFVLVLVRMSGLADALRRREDRFRSLVLNASDGFAIVDARGRISYVSPATKRLLGYPTETLIGSDALSLFHPEQRQESSAFFAEVLAEPRVLQTMVARVRHEDGSWRWMETSATNLVEDPAVEGIVLNYHDLTDKKEAEDALRESEASSRMLFDSSPMPMWVYSRGTLRFLAVNDAAVAHYRYSRDEFLHMTIADIRPVEEVPALLQDLERDREGLEGPNRWRHRKKDGAEIEVEISSHLLDFAGEPATLVAARDVTETNRVAREKEALEVQLAQSQKLEAIGQLAGGIAHDFNNLISVISNYAKFARDSSEDPVSSREDIDQVLVASDKAAKLVRQLLAFSRREIVRPERVDLNEIVAEMDRLLKRTLKENIDLVVEMTSSPLLTMVDRGQLEQVVLNLIVNADAAMPDGGTLEIRTFERTFGDEASDSAIELVPGHYACLSISDDGQGMSGETLAHAFEPFYTTKPVGQGSGLGLSTVYGIIKQAGGHVSVYTELGLGTTFVIYLPLAPDETAPTPPEEVAPLGDLTGTGTILVVEDEDGVREIARRMLEGAGYQVLTAATPMEALELVGRGSGARIDLVLTDVIMPGLSGRALVERLRSLKPSLKVVFMSGYPDEIIANHGILEPDIFFVQKPFGADELLAKVKEAMSVEHDGAREPDGRKSSVLIVDDEPDARLLLKWVLESYNFAVIGEAADGVTAVEMAREQNPDFVVLDYRMPGMDGERVAPLLREVAPDTYILAFSALLSDRPEWADTFLSKEEIGDLPPLLERLVSS